MTRITQKEIAEKVGISGAYLSQLLNGRRRSSYMVAKRLETIVGIPIKLWMEGTPKQIQQLYKTRIESGWGQVEV